MVPSLVDSMWELGSELHYRAAGVEDEAAVLESIPMLVSLDGPPQRLPVPPWAVSLGDPLDGAVGDLWDRARLRCSEWCATYPPTSAGA